MRKAYRVREESQSRSSRAEDVGQHIHHGLPVADDRTRMRDSMA